MALHFFASQCSKGWMTDFSSLLQADRGQAACKIHMVDTQSFDTWLASQSTRTRTACAAGRFTGKADELVILSGDTPEEWSVAIGVSNVAAPAPWCLAAAAQRLPAGTYRLVDGTPGDRALGWLLAQHRFSRYRKNGADEGPRVLLTSDPAAINSAIRMAEATALVRDLVDTPAEDLGPAELAEAVEAEAAQFGATVNIVQGEQLRSGFPSVHAVGRAAAKAARLIDLTWGNPDHPRITLVGKGVTFDSGGLDIKPSSGMRHMKKDMGGAAHALALARLVMQSNLPVRLRLLIPAVENAIAGNAFRPGDILATRKGLTVEIGNTDAEGRLVLSDALTCAQEDKPALLLDFATLTGAARVALGPDLPALFTNDDGLAQDLSVAATDTDDPLWRMPLWQPYKDLLKSEIADIGNASESAFAGCITAALFLERFIDPGTVWAHIDLFAWRPSAKPGRPKGGEAMTIRAIWRMLQTRYGS